MLARIHVGTVGFRHLHWTGAFYPRGLDADGMLTVFAGQLGALELSLEALDDLRAATRHCASGRDGGGLRLLVALPQQWLHLPGRLPFHPGLELLEELATAGALAGVHLPLDERLAPTRDHAIRLRRLAKVFADQGLVIDLPGGAWRQPAVLQWLDRIGVSVAWRVDTGRGGPHGGVPRRLPRPRVCGPTGVVRLPAAHGGAYGLEALRRLMPPLTELARTRFDVLVLLEERGTGDGAVRDARALQMLVREQVRREDDTRIDTG